MKAITPRSCLIGLTTLGVVALVVYLLSFTALPSEWIGIIGVLAACGFPTLVWVIISERTDPMWTKKYAKDIEARVAAQTRTTCPRCKSTNIEPFKKTQVMHTTEAKWYCNRCHAVFFPWEHDARK